MHRSRRRAAGAVLACLLGTACSPGTGGSPADGPAAGATTLRYLIEEPEDAAAMAALEERIAGFEEESGVAVQVDSLPHDTMRRELQAQLRSEQGPDVFSWGSGPGFGGALARAGLVADLTEAYQERGWEVYDFAEERVSVDGTVYGVPGELETIGLFYNVDVFTELGLPAPRSLPELADAARAVRDSGRVPLAVGDEEGWEGGHLLSMALSSSIGSEGMEALFSGERSWRSPEVVAALRLWQDFDQQGLLTESPQSVDYDTSTSLFFSGEAAMIPTGSWLVGEIDDNTDFEVDFIPFPGPDGPGIFTGGLGSGPFVSASTDAPEAAIDFVDFLASAEHGRWTVENLHTLPPRQVDTSGLEVSPLFAQVLEVTADLATRGDVGHNIDVMASDELNEAMYAGVKALLAGRQTPEQVAASLEAARS